MDRILAGDGEGKKKRTNEGNGNDSKRVRVERLGELKSQFLNIITMSRPDWFGVSIFKSVEWEMSERRKEMTAQKR